MGDLERDEVASLTTTPLIMTPPQDWNGRFALAVEATVTDVATLSTGAASSTISATTTIPVTINPVNDAPVANADTLTGIVEAGGTNNGDLGVPTVAAIDVLANDTDVDNPHTARSPPPERRSGPTASLPC